MLNRLWRNADFVRLWTSLTITHFGGQITFLALPLTAALLVVPICAWFGVPSMGVLYAVGFLMGTGAVTGRPAYQVFMTERVGASAWPRRTPGSASAIPPRNSPWPGPRHCCACVRWKRPSCGASRASRKRWPASGSRDQPGRLSLITQSRAKAAAPSVPCTTLNRSSAFAFCPARWYA